MKPTIIAPQRTRTGIRVCRAALLCGLVTFLCACGQKGPLKPLNPAPTATVPAAAGAASAPAARPPESPR